jgi:hypothetical protein
MKLLDENIIASQRELLGSWKIPVRQIGYDFEQSGLDDLRIISLLHRQRRITFFTRDLGFFDRQLCHGRYCLVCLAVTKEEVATFVRRFLRDERFKTQAQRHGSVIQVSQTGIRSWQVNSKKEMFVAWATQKLRTGRNPHAKPEHGLG